jgi:rhodanese-related sulfurtransferase
LAAAAPDESRRVPSVNFRHFSHARSQTKPCNSPQQPVAKEWLTHLRNEKPDATLWDVPVVDAPGFLEGTIRNGMTGERPDVEVRKRTVPVFAASEGLEKAMEIPNKTQVWVGVIASSGKLVSSLRGPWTAERESQVLSAAKTCSPGGAAAASAQGASDVANEAPLRTVTALELKQLVSKPGGFVFDCNGADLYREGHVPSAKMMAYDQVSAATLPADKNATLVFYCYNPQCTASVTVARAARKLGYANAVHFPGGITGWRAAGLPIEK